MIDNEEYKTLRDEIIHSYTIVDSSRNVLYIAVAYMLTFATNKNNPLLYLLPFAVIIPVYLIAINYTFDMYRIGTYIMVFGEGTMNGRRWETRQYQLNTQHEKAMPRQAKIFHIPYVSLGVACFILFLLSLDYKEVTVYSFSLLILGVVLFFTLLSIYAYYHDMISVQKRYIQGWKEIKRKEEGKPTSDNRIVMLSHTSGK